MNCGTTPIDQLLLSCMPNLHREQPKAPPSSLINPSLAPPSAAISGENSGLIGYPLNTMPTNRLMAFPTDPGFVERAARYSCFSSGTGNYGALATQLGNMETVKLSRVSSSQSTKAKATAVENRAPSEFAEAEFGSGREESSVTDLWPSPRESSVRKRKGVPKSKAKVAEENAVNVKKCRPAETGDVKEALKPKEEENFEKGQAKNEAIKPPEPPKDYIHVRARRGQATDSHSLAERVRREKISQRMKLLQDLVPGCNKITGKALMLDEIINYVQSLQCQVEFLSMKIATVNPGLACNLDSLISKEPLLNQPTASLPSSVYPLDNLPLTFPFGHHHKEGNTLPFGDTNVMETHFSLSQYDSIRQCMQPTSLDVFGADASQVGNLWDDELHTVVNLGFFQNQETGISSQNFDGQLPTANMKAEL
ncbi:hypothetical protein HPP92_011788 [Vanilla planifolia]|uniref:BHLH domain-containing protein n=1 Tax=Vanilla planifolia TaxID=51239 RepID=A0A835R3L0_VANPL|nr:hypothetical protein HPP92_011788 [Vanilla planifolia]